MIGIAHTLKSGILTVITCHNTDNMNTQIRNLTTLLNTKEDRITELELKVKNMENAIDQQEQFSRRPNVRVHGLPETGDMEDATVVVMAVVNKMSLQPPLRRHHIERSHRTGPKTDKQGAVRTRPISVRFMSKRSNSTTQGFENALPFERPQ